MNATKMKKINSYTYMMQKMVIITYPFVTTLGWTTHMMFVLIEIFHYRYGGMDIFRGELMEY
jgi:hypothetical protein